MRRRLSSLQTFLMKVIFPAVWGAMFGSGAVAMFLGPGRETDATAKWMFLFVWVAGCAFVYWSCVRLKAVSVDDNFLYVSNYVREIPIPLTEIYDVTENVWLNIHPVTIHLKSPSEFGDKIVFMPKVRAFAFFSSHPVVAELKELAAERGAAAKYIR